jgi:hypothetical protein
MALWLAPEGRAVSDEPKWKENKGELPRGARGKRVRVKLRWSGEEPFYNSDVTSAIPPGWPADGKGGCRWSLDGGDYDITHYVIM